MKNLRLLLPVLFLAACSTHSAIERSRDYIRVGDYMHAFQVLDDARNEQLRDGGSVDEALELNHASVRKEYLRDRARRAIFQEREELAVADLAELERLDPAYPELEALKWRANHKRAIRSVQRGEEQLLRKEYVEALASFLEAGQIEPGLEGATAGIAKVKAVTDQLSVRAQQQFLEAVRKLPEFRFIEVQWHSGNVINNAPEREDAKQLRSKALRENAKRELAIAVDCEKKQQYGAAMLHFREAQRLDPSLPDIEARIVRMEREMEASVMIDRSQMMIRAGRFDEARKQLAEAFEKSELSRAQVSDLMMQTRQLEGMKRYQEARDLEVMGRKAEALAAFEGLSKDWAEGLVDEKARIDSLRVDLAGAASEWAEAEAAEAAGDLPKALDHYRNSERFCANWKDGKARIQRLQEAIAKKAAETAPAAPAEQPKADAGDAPRGN